MRILSSHPEGMPAKDVLSQLRTIVPPTPFELSEYPNRPGVVRDKIVRFSTIGPVKAGWLVKTKGQWSVTEAGTAALQHFATNPEELMREAARLYRQWKKDQPEPPDEEESASDEDVESVGTLEEAEESAFAEIKSYVDAMAPYDFQDLVAALLSALGYHLQWIAPPGPDQGVDIIATNDDLGLSKPRVKVQVKHRTSTATVSDLREFMALLGESDVGIYVATGGFTRDAYIAARNQETRTVTLVDLEEFIDLWIKNYSSIAEDGKLLLPVKPVYYLALPAEPAGSSRSSVVSAGARFR